MLIPALFAGAIIGLVLGLVGGGGSILAVPLLVYLVGSIVRVAMGEKIAGEPWEFWGYIITALIIPVAAVYWAILERTRWSNFVMGAVGVTALVMAARMNQIWY